MEEQIYSDFMVRRALRGHVVIRMINLILGFAFQILVVKILVPMEYAAYAVLLAFLMLAQVFTLLGIDRTILRFIPGLTKNRELRAMWGFIGKILAVRLSVVAAFVLALVIGQYYFFELLHIGDSNTVLISTAIWFLSLTILADADALAQSWMLHFHAALIATSETFSRIAVVTYFYLRHDAIDFETIVVLSTATFTMATVLLTLRLAWFTRHLEDEKVEGSKRTRNLAADLAKAPSYGTASYIATLGWVLTNPLLIRIVASTGLGIIALGAFSFAQGLMYSITRALPGMLILPAIEPVLMADVGSAERSPRITGALSLAVKLEFLAILSLLIPTSVAGQDILRFLAKPDFAPYFFVIPFLLIYFMFSIIYRVVEIVIRMAFRHQLFILLWPLGLLSLALTYITVSYWGIWSVLIWPIVEIVLRIFAVLVIFKVDGAKAAIDPARSGLLAGSAILIIMSLLTIQYIFGAENLSASTNLTLGFAGVATLGATLFLLRPLRPVESEHLLRILPRKWPVVDSLLCLLTRR